MSLIQKLQNRNTLDGLTDLYQEWLAGRNYPNLSADELHHELVHREPRPVDDIDWLGAFLNHWWHIQNDSDKVRS